MSERQLMAYALIAIVALIVGALLLRIAARNRSNRYRSDRIEVRIKE